MIRRFATLLITCGVGVLCLGASSVANAQAYRLRADAFGQAQSPTGVVALSGESEFNTWLSAEALLWAGGSEDFDGEGDVMTMVVRARAPDGLGELRLGRQVIATGAIRPVHADGLAGILRLPWGTAVEAFGGLTVVPEFDSRAGDWIVGSRVSHTLLGLGTAGVSIVHGQEDGLVGNQEVGADLLLVPASWVDISARGAWDLITSGLTEAHGAVSARVGKFRFEAYASHRDPERLLPATSLFTVLGASTSTFYGGEVRWRAAPRLDVSMRGGARIVDDPSEELRLRATLRLDDKGEGAVSFEARRQGSDRGPWTGVRATARLPFAETWIASTEFELVIPDDDAGRGTIWPWGLVAVGWYPTPTWEVAVAGEARSSPEVESAYDVLLRATYRFGGWSGS